MQEQNQEVVLPADWIERYFWVPRPRNPKTGEMLPAGPIQLTDHQKHLINEALSRNPDGTFKYALVVYSAPKKSGKSAVAAAVATYVAHHSPYGFIACVANDGKQANDRIYAPIKQNYRLHRQQQGPFKDINPYEYEVTIPNFCKIEAVPVDAAGEAGGEPTLSVFSELWGFDTPKKRQLWTELTVPPTLYGYAMQWVESYAGYTGVSILLESLYNTGKKEGTPHPDFSYLDTAEGPVVYTHAPSRMFMYWDTEPRMPWQIPEYYCLPLPKKKEDLRVLTSTGWKPAEDISVKDRVCTRTNTGEIQYQKPKEIFVAPYEGDLYRLKTNRVDISMTPNHRVLAQYIPHTRKHKKLTSEPPIYEYKEAKDASRVQAGKIPTRGEWKHAPLPDVVIEDQIFDAGDFLELLTWFLTEGSVQKHKIKDKTYYNCFFIAQDSKKNPDKVARIVDLLDRMALNYTVNSVGVYVFNSPLSRYFKDFGHSYQKHFPRYVLEECSKEQLQRILDVYILGDGTASSVRRTLYTNSDAMLLDLMELVFKAGHTPKYVGSYSSDVGGGRKPIHHIAIQDLDLGWVGYGKRNSWSVEKAPENTRVWCPVLPNGNFYCMVNGRTFWTGNSEQRNTLEPEEFERIHRNRWVSAKGAFIEAQWWDNCESPSLPVLKQGDKTPVVVAIDMSVSNDLAAMVAVTRDPINPDTDVAVRAVKIFNPKKLGGNIDQEQTVGNTIREWASRWNVICWVYDPYQMAKLVQDYRKDGFGWFDPFTQNTARGIADKQLYDMVMHRQLTWNRTTTIGDVGSPGIEDDTLYQHIRQAGAVISGRQRRLEKLSPEAKIDAAVALSMAAYKCMELELDNREFEKEDLLQMLAKGEIELEAFSQIVRQKFPELGEKYIDGSR